MSHPGSRTNTIIAVEDRNPLTSCTQTPGYRRLVSHLQGPANVHSLLREHLYKRRIVRRGVGRAVQCLQGHCSATSPLGAKESCINRGALRETLMLHPEGSNRMRQEWASVRPAHSL